LLETPVFANHSTETGYRLDWRSSSVKSKRETTAARGFYASAAWIAYLKERIVSNHHGSNKQMPRPKYGLLRMGSPEESNPMTLSATIGSTAFVRRGATFFNELGIYRFCVAIAVIDCLDLMDALDLSQSNFLLKYSYAAIVIIFFVTYFMRWKIIDTTNPAPIIFLLFFTVTGLAFAIRLFLYDEHESYISAFIAPLVFSAAIFIPRNAIMVDERRILKGLMYIFALGTVCYLLEAIIRPLDFFTQFSYVHEVQFVKSLSCILALCLFILTGQKILALLTAAITAIALLLRPTSTIALVLILCVPIAVVLRSRVLYFRPLNVLVARVLAMTTLIIAVSVPILMYFYLDDLGPLVVSWEGYLKGDILGGQSNSFFRLAILQVAFESVRDTSFWFGSALSGSVTVPLGKQEGFQWWFSAAAQSGGEAPIHSDFVITFVLMGIAGLSALAAGYYLALKALFRGFISPRLRGDGVVIRALAIIALVAVFIYSSDEAYLSCYSHANVVWLLLLVSEMLRKAKPKLAEVQENRSIALKLVR
jgi:hypothetical protein